jgi:tagaturonate reductase
MKEEISPAVPYPVSPDVVLQYADKVLDRFRNPFLEHQWLSISQNYSTKMRTRCVPLLLRHYELHNSVPQRMALGFAAYLCFTRPVVKKNNEFYGECNGDLYRLKDDASAVFYQRWAQLSTSDLVKEVLRDNDFWEADLSELPGFAEAVEEKLTLLLNGAFEEALAINRQS